MKYELNDKPGTFAWLLYGLQWWIVSLPCIIIIGLVVTNVHGADTAGQTLYLQKLFGIMGAGMTVQVLWGHRLPLIIGPASVLLIGIVAATGSSLSAIYTSIFIGGLLLVVLAYSGLLSKVQAIFTSRIITVILILIAFTLTPVILNMVFGDTQYPLLNFFFSLILVVLLVLGNAMLKGIWKSMTLIGGVIIGTIGYYLLTGFPSGSPEIESGVSLSFFNFSFEFEPVTIISFLFCYIALIINELGSINAVGRMLGADQMVKRTNSGMGILGLFNMGAGVLGVVGPVDYSMSPGIIAATGCASRFTLIPAGIGLLVCAFLPGIISSLVHLPSIVLGAVLLYLMSTQLSAALQMLAGEKAIYNFDTGIIVGLPLMVALFISFAPQAVLQQIPAFIRPILGNGFVMGVFFVLAMEHLVFRKRKE